MTEHTRFFYQSPINRNSLKDESQTTVRNDKVLQIYVELPKFVGYISAAALDMTGIITTIQRLSIHDGPGIRSTVFLKGCNMKCLWCHNPETWMQGPSLQHLQDKCICCGHCLEACPNGAISVLEGKINIDRNFCSLCGRCTESCVSRALTMIGESVTPEELLKRVLRDKICYDNSGGGVTLSGGEPTLQKDFCIEFLKLCKSEGLHTAIETNLSCSEKTIDELAPWLDLWMCDLKMANTAKHIKNTGLSNALTVSNLRHLSDIGARLVVRTPIIPGINDSAQDIREICEIVKDLRIEYYELLPYHSMGLYKFPTIGIDNPLPPTGDMNKDALKPLYEIVRTYDINALNI